MRKTLVRTLAELARDDDRILLLTGDLGYTVVEPFVEEFPDRFFNMGVAEQNMLGVATGLAEAGFIPFCYSIATFASLRPYEFIRNGPILHRLPVRIVGVGGGFEYGFSGPTHHGLEDVGVLRIQPGITVIAPADWRQAQTAFMRTWDLTGPVYYRLGKDDTNLVPGLDGRFQLGRAHVMGDGKDLLLVSMGSITKEVAEASEILSKRGLACTIVVLASLNPAPVGDLVAILSQFRFALTFEAHYVVGGIGSLTSEIVAGNGLDCRVLRFGVNTTPTSRGGSESYLHRLHGLTSESIAETALRVWHEYA